MHLELPGLHNAPPAFIQQILSTVPTLRTFIIRNYTVSNPTHSSEIGTLPACVTPLRELALLNSTLPSLLKQPHSILSPSLTTLRLWGGEHDEGSPFLASASFLPSTFMNLHNLQMLSLRSCSKVTFQLLCGADIPVTHLFLDMIHESWSKWDDDDMNLLFNNFGKRLQQLSFIPPKNSSFSVTCLKDLHFRVPHLEILSFPTSLGIPNTFLDSNDFLTLFSFLLYTPHLKVFENPRFMVQNLHNAHQGRNVQEFLRLLCHWDYMTRNEQTYRSGGPPIKWFKAFREEESIMRIQHGSDSAMNVDLFRRVWRGFGDGGFEEKVDEMVDTVLNSLVLGEIFQTVL